MDQLIEFLKQVWDILSGRKEKREEFLKWIEESRTPADVMENAIRMWGYTGQDLQDEIICRLELLPPPFRQERDVLTRKAVLNGLDKIGEYFSKGYVDDKSFFDLVSILDNVKKVGENYSLLISRIFELVENSNSNHLTIFFDSVVSKVVVEGDVPEWFKSIIESSSAQQLQSLYVFLPCDYDSLYMMIIFPVLFEKAKKEDDFEIMWLAFDVVPPDSKEESIVVEELRKMAETEEQRTFLREL